MAEVSDALPHLDEPGDAELISAVRGGDTQAYGMLFERHVAAARRLARQLVSAGDVDDLVSESFAKVLGVLQRGGGPDLAFRAYLLTSIRRLHVDKLRSGARLQTTDDLTPYDPGVPFQDTAVAGFENATAAKAFASLPERWQQVLWHTEVEGQKPADIAPLLGMSANSVSALAYRAREGLREAFVSMHAQDAVEDACATTRANLGAYIRGGSSKRDAAKVEAHLTDCRECSGIYLELAEVNSNLGAVLAPLLLGSAGAGYLAAANAGALVATKGGLLLLLDRAKDWVLHNPAGRATGGAAAAVAAAVAVTAAVQASAGHHTDPSAAPSRPSARSTPSPSAPPTSTAPVPPTAPVIARPTPLLPPPPTVTRTALTSPATAAATATAQQAPVISVPLSAVALLPGADAVTIDLTRGATDPDGDPLTVSSARIAGASPHGTVSPGGTAATRIPALLARPGSGPTTVTYTPQRAWRGTETIRYVLTDGHGGTVAGTVAVTTPNRTPVAASDYLELHATYTAPAQGRTVDVLGNDTDPNGDPLTVTGVGPATLGTVTLAGGQVRYTPPVWPRGQVRDQTDTFGYTVSDGFGGTAAGTVTVLIGLTPNQAPDAEDSSLSTHWTASSSGAVDLGATDADGDALTFAPATGPAHGSVTISAGGHAVYTPSGSYVGDDSFTWTVSDGKDSATGTTSVRITNAHAPEQAEETREIGDGETATVTIPAADADGDPISVTGISGETRYDEETRTISWDAPFGQDSDHTVSYTASDGIDAATVTVHVQARMLRGTLVLDDHHEASSSADSANHLRLAGLPAGRSASVRIRLTGWTGWVGGFHTAEGGASCHEVANGEGAWTITCQVHAGGDFLHLDFDHGPTWSLEATATADDFVADEVSLSRP